MLTFAFDPCDLPETIPALRKAVREFLAREMTDVPPLQRARSWSAFDPAFSRKVGAEGWIGMTWPRQYGGGERSPIERYVLIEELLAAGAPVGAHWIADRQSGPLLLRYGTEQQRRRYLPGIARGELHFCIGMSEPSSGSDLASVRTRAVRTAEGWRINGSKLWTTHAHHAHMMIALVRTSGDDKSRQAGLSQFLVDLAAPGITVRPVADLVGDTHFNEVFFDDVLVPHENVIGGEGDGWKQVTSELSLERSGPERYLSSYLLFRYFVEAAGPNPPEAVRLALGQLSAQLWALREMSLSVAGQLAAGRDPAVEASVVKDLGNSFEQEIPRVVQSLLDSGLDLDGSTPFLEVLAFLLQTSPSFSLRGGTREILRGIIARGIGLR